MRIRLFSTQIDKKIQSLKERHNIETTLTPISCRFEQNGIDITKFSNACPDMQYIIDKKDFYYDFDIDTAFYKKQEFEVEEFETLFPHAVLFKGEAFATRQQLEAMRNKVRLVNTNYYICRDNYITRILTDRYKEVDIQTVLLNYPEQHYDILKEYLKVIFTAWSGYRIALINESKVEVSQDYEVIDLKEIKDKKIKAIADSMSKHCKNEFKFDNSQIIVGKMLHLYKNKKILLSLDRAHLNNPTLFEKVIMEVYNIKDKDFIQTMHNNLLNMAMQYYCEKEIKKIKRGK